MKAASHIPMIETERLILRAHVVGDHEALFAMRCDPEVYRHISGAPATQEDSWRRTLSTVGHWALMGYGYWLVEEKATGALVGEAGFSDFRREIDPTLDGTLEAGWALASTHHGKGYASEAVRAVLRWAQEHHAETPVTCIIAPENAASIALAKRLGFVERGMAAYKDADSLLFDWRGFPG